ncbi:MAG: DoxX family protein [Isosphaeraceae bacterium]|nr:DoxX family protein [Isosphaeraceae bacterium]
MLLRIAIGWHFAYEGMEKIDSHRRGGKPFSAEVYLRNSTGPLAPYFRGMVPDVNSLAKLDPARLKATWDNEIKRIGDHYGFDADQRSKAAEIERKSGEEADLWFQDRLFNEKRQKYFHELAETQATERNWGALSYERERAAAGRKSLDADRRELVKDIDTIEGALRDAVVKLATPAQVEAAGPYLAKAPVMDWAHVRSLKWERLSTLDRVNLATMYGLLVMGLCLMAGFLSRPAALAGAVFLGQIYLSMPPWPGLPANPMAEGHYMIVNKNLIEMLACLALAFLPTGRWIGVDALLFNWIGRGRQRDEDHEDDEQERGRRRRSHTLAQPRSY